MQSELQNHVAAYVKDNWQEIAVFAYSGYQMEGRGLVWFSDGIQGNAFGFAQVEYIPRERFVSFWSSRMDVTDAIATIDSYDPDLAIVLFVSQPGLSGKTAFLTGRFDLKPSPKDLWERHKDDPTVKE